MFLRLIFWNRRVLSREPTKVGLSPLYTQEGRDQLRSEQRATKIGFVHRATPRSIETLLLAIVTAPPSPWLRQTHGPRSRSTQGRSFVVRHDLGTNVPFDGFGGGPLCTRIGGPGTLSPHLILPPRSRARAAPMLAASDTARKIGPTVLERSGNGADKSNTEGHMRNIVNEAGEVIAKVTIDGILVGGHHRIIAAGNLGQELRWQDTGEPAKLDALMRQSTHRHIA